MNSDMRSSDLAEDLRRYAEWLETRPAGDLIDFRPQGRPKRLPLVGACVMFVALVGLLLVGRSNREESSTVADATPTTFEVTSPSGLVITGTISDSSLSVGESTDIRISLRNGSADAVVLPDLASACPGSAVLLGYVQPDPSWAEGGSSPGERVTRELLSGAGSPSIGELRLTSMEAPDNPGACGSSAVQSLPPGAEAEGAFTWSYAAGLIGAEPTPADVVLRIAADDLVGLGELQLAGDPEPSATYRQAFEEAVADPAVASIIHALAPDEINFADMTREENRWRLTVSVNEQPEIDIVVPDS